MILLTYSQESLTEMASKIDLREYASKTVDFVRHSGDTEYAVCCFHDEKTASLAVTPEIYHCFGCSAYGNIYTWIQQTEHLTFDQAVQKVADLTGSEVNSYIESDIMNFYKQLKKICYPKKNELIVRNVLDKEKDYIQRFKDEIPQEWLDEGISAEEMKKYEIRIDPISNRIVYPVYSDDDELISVKGRTRFKNYKDLKIMKYMNYYKLGGRLDYFQGMQQARPFIKKKNEIIIFEGIKSVMKADAWGFHNVVAAETSALNEFQVELLIKMQMRDVIIAFDKDVKIKKISECAELLKKFTNVYVVCDKWNLIDSKDSPTDKGESVWRMLYNKRTRLL